MDLAAVKLRFLKTNPDTGQPIPFISSTDPKADIYETFGAGPMFPSLVELPRKNWTRIKRVHPDANFYIYWAAHKGKNIKMAWSSSLDGPWVEYNNPQLCDKNANCKLGVMPLPQPKRRWNHVSAPDVMFNAKHRRFVMFYHGLHAGRGGHSSFIASSDDGLDFSGSYTDGSLLHAKGTAMRTINNGRIRPVIVGTNYSRSFSHDADGDGKPEYYVIGKRGRVCRLPHNIWSSDVHTWANQSNIQGAAYHNVAKCDQLPEDMFHIVDNPHNYSYQYASPLTEFLASTEFMQHSNNPHPGETVHSFAIKNQTLAYKEGMLHSVNHVGIWKQHNAINLDRKENIGMMEVYFYVKSPELLDGRSLDRYRGLYRVIYDLRDYRTEEQKRSGIEPFETWRLMLDPDGRVVFDVAVSPDMGLGAAGDSFIHTFCDGKKCRKYIFFTTGPEGNIYGAEMLTQSLLSTST